MQRLLHVSSRQAWPLLAAAALAATVIGHALQLILEDLQLFGDARAGYVHSGQAICAELAVCGLIAALYSVIRYLLQMRAHGDADSKILFLRSVTKLGRGRTLGAILFMQFAALIVVESCEQRFSGYGATALGAIFGAGHGSALFVHLIVGTIIGLVIYAFAASVSSRSQIFAQAISSFLRRLRAGDGAGHAAAFRRLHVRRTARKLPLLSLGLANRPPPTAASA
jgi:hypothetical protein